MNNNQATIEKLDAMRLRGMSRSFRATIEGGVRHQFSADEMVAHLTDSEWDERHNRRVQRLLKSARFRYSACVEEIDFGLNRNLDRNQMVRLSDCGWIERHQNLIFTGPTGSGKSFLASALGHQSCLYGYKTGYYRCSTLFKHLGLCRSDGSYLKELTRLSKQELIILDDFGLEGFDGQARLSLLEILEDRHGRRATIVVSQVPVNRWHETIGDETIADAICDRITHSAHRIELKGESVRKIYGRRDIEREKSAE